MAKKAAIKSSNIQVAFEAISIEGGLLSPEWLSKIAQLQADAQTPADYKIPKGLTLRDEIGRYWRIAEALWNDYRSKTEGLADTAKLTENFVVTLLTQCLGFDDLSVSESITIGDRIYPIGYTAGGGLVPVVVSSPQEALDSLAERFGEDHRKRTAFGLLQEYLNASEKVLWGVVCDGETLRIVRDNASLTKPAWIESDLKRIFQEQRFADFAAFWLACHRTRFGITGSPPDECILENWRNSCKTEGTRARNQLRVGVEEALEVFGQGFIAHPENVKLRTAVMSGELSAQNYFQEILRLVYRLIFILTIEERDLLHPNETTESIRKLYGDGYSLKRLRDRAIKRHTFDRFSDLWESLKIVFRGLGKGEQNLGLPALGGLFAEDQTPALDVAKIENRFLLMGILKLCWLKEETGVSRVNWRDMGPEELGSVYESLLELVPQIIDGGRQFTFAGGDEVRGNARKLSGSYYTPDNLVQALLDKSLEPVIARVSAAAAEPIKELLSIKVIDPACGSGHFLLAAARRLAGHIARLQVGGTPTGADYRRALRHVISNCIFGVDKNPMALELARTALWLEAMTPESSLSFLDHHLVCGDALFGLLDLELLANGIPKEAFSELSGDVAQVCKDLASENAKKLKQLKKSREDSQNAQLFDLNNFSLVPILQGIESMPDDTTDAVELKKIALENYLSASSNAGVAIAADMFVTAFLAPKTASTKNLIPTTDDILRALRGTLPPIATLNFVRKIVRKERVLHWQLKFSQVFAKGGFDVILGNPPWEKINFKDEEYFASKNPEIANAENKSKRKELLDKLSVENPAMYAEYEQVKRVQDAFSVFCRFSGRYPLTGVSRINLYSVFCETGVKLLSPGGRLGLVIASGIATDDNNKQLLEELISGQRLIHTWDFENREGIFPDVDSRFKFCLFVAGGKNTKIPLADFAFYLTNINQVSEIDRHFTLTAEELVLLNPNSRTCPSFRNRREAEITKHIYRRVPPWQLHEKTSVWPGVPKTPFNMSNDSGLFVDLTQRGLPEFHGQDLVPLYESKFIHQFNHRFATFSEADQDGAVEFTLDELRDNSRLVESRYWIPHLKLNERFPGKWFLAYRMIARATDERTTIATILPEVACGNSLSIIESLSVVTGLYQCSVLNSFVFDFCARQKVAGTNFNHWIMHQLPFPTSTQLQLPCAWEKDKSNLEWITGRAFELLYTATDLGAFAGDFGVTAPPFVWNETRRFVLRAEIDAALFYLFLGTGINGAWETETNNISSLSDCYASPRDAITYILDSFPITRDREMKKSGQYKTKIAILRIYDSLLEAAKLDSNYVTPDLSDLDTVVPRTQTTAVENHHG